MYCKQILRKVCNNCFRVFWIKEDYMNVYFLREDNNYNFRRNVCTRWIISAIMGIGAFCYDYHNMTHKVSYTLITQQKPDYQVLASGCP